MRRRQLEKYMEFVACTECAGTRLNPQARSVAHHVQQRSCCRRKRPTVAQPARRLRLSIATPSTSFESLELDETRPVDRGRGAEGDSRPARIPAARAASIISRSTAPPRPCPAARRSASAWRARSAAAWSACVYILDEPSIGLHPRDNALLLDSLKNLRDQGNTVIVVEHDEDTMRAADHIVDFGPGPGVRGGEVVAQGTVEDLRKEPKSLTGQYLSGELVDRRFPAQRRPRGKKSLKIVGRPAQQPPERRRRDSAGAFRLRHRR